MRKRASFEKSLYGAAFLRKQWEFKQWAFPWTTQDKSVYGSESYCFPSVASWFQAYAHLLSEHAVEKCYKPVAASPETLTR